MGLDDRGCEEDGGEGVIIVVAIAIIAPHYRGKLVRLNVNSDVSRPRSYFM